MLQNILHDHLSNNDPLIDSLVEYLHIFAIQVKLCIQQAQALCTAKTCSLDFGIDA